MLFYCNIWIVIILPIYKNKKDNTIFDVVFIAICSIWLFSNINTFSRAKDDMVVNDPQKPIATKKEYFGSKFRETEHTENTPKTKLPIMLAIITFEPMKPTIKGIDVSLYLKNAPVIAPKDNKINSTNPFIVMLIMLINIYYLIAFLSMILIYPFFKIYSRLFFILFLKMTNFL